MTKVDNNVYVWLDKTTAQLWTFQVRPKIAIDITEDCFGITEVDPKLKKLSDLVGWIQNSELLGVL